MTGTATLCPNCGIDLCAAERIEMGPLVYDPRGDVTWYGQRVRMARGQRTVLEALAREAPRVVSLSVLAERLDYDGDGNVVEVLLSRIRRALPGAPIENVRGLGWRWAL